MSQDRGRVLFIADGLTWLGANLFNESSKFRAEGYLQVRYEDLVDHPLKGGI